MTRVLPFFCFRLAFFFLLRWMFRQKSTIRPSTVEVDESLSLENNLSTEVEAVDRQHFWARSERRARGAGGSSTNQLLVGLVRSAAMTAPLSLIMER
jgi:hypothetical protein